MRIIQLIDSLTVGGTERMAVNISNALCDDGHETFLISTRKGGDLLQHLNKEVAYWNANKKASFDLSVFLDLVKKIKAFQPEVIHAHSSSVYWAIALKIFMPKFKLVFHDHYGMSEQIKPDDRKWLRWLSYFIDYTIVVNQNLLDWNLKYTHVERAKIVFIRNFPYLKNNQDRSTKSTDKSILQLVCLANLRKQKDHFTLVRALKIVKDGGYNFHAKFVGSKWEDHYEFNVKEAIQENNLIDQIEITGALNNIKAVLAESDIGILSSTSEGLPVSLLEYGLAGLPVVVTDVGQCAEVVGHGQYGEVVPPGAPTELALALIRIMDDYESAQKMGKGFKQHILNEYGSQKFLKEYFRLIDA